MATTQWPQEHSATKCTNRPGLGQSVQSKVSGPGSPHTTCGGGGDDFLLLCCCRQLSDWLSLFKTASCDAAC
eukprot:6509189-Heterocapsa_arctica.AAC.1